MTTTTDTCTTCDGTGEVELQATPAEVDAGYELGVAYDPCPVCHPPEHPAKWSANVLGTLAKVRRDHLPTDRVPSVLDPFAGVGIDALAAALVGTTDRPTAAANVVGVELQPEWTDRGPMPRTVQGDATQLPENWTGTFDAVFTSPCYGNRMADHHDAKDTCKVCRGSGCRVPDCLGAHPDDGAEHRWCATCKGTGLSWRNTYAHALRRAGGDLVAGSAAGMQWGRAYRELHRLAIAEMRRVVVESGLLVVNMSNHVRDGAEQLVVEWWVNELIVQGCRLVEVRRVATPRNGMGANGDVRVDGEVVIVMRTPAQRGLL